MRSEEPVLQIPSAKIYEVEGGGGWEMKVKVGRQRDRERWKGV